MNNELIETEEQNQLPDPSPPEYLKAVEDFISNNDFIRGTVFEEPIRRGYQDYMRFFGWMTFLEPYISWKDKKVLDSGCGVGGLMVALSQKGAVPSGVEVDKYLYDMAKIRFKRFDGVRVELLNSDVMPFEDNFFDAAFSMHVVEHVRNLDLYLQEFLRVLKPGGIALIEFPNRLFPVEAHTGLYLFPWMPMKLASRICRILSQVRIFSKDLRLKFRNLGDESLGLHFITRPDIKKLLESKVEILEESYPISRLLAEAGQGFFADLLKLIPRVISKRFSWIFQRNITLIIRKI